MRPAPSSIPSIRLGKAVRPLLPTDRIRQPIPPAGQFQMIPGRGVRVLQDGMEILAGNPEMLAEHGVNLPDDASQRAGELYLHRADTVIYIAAGGRLAGFLVLVRRPAQRQQRHDPSGCQRTGVTPVLLTGDHANAAQNIAAQLAHPRGACRLPAGRQAPMD